MGDLGRKVCAEYKSLLQKWAVLRQKPHFYSDSAGWAWLDLMSQVRQKRKMWQSLMAHTPDKANLWNTGWQSQTSDTPGSVKTIVVMKAVFEINMPALVQSMQRLTGTNMVFSTRYGHPLIIIQVTKLPRLNCYKKSRNEKGKKVVANRLPLC